MSCSTSRSTMSCQGAYHRLVSDRDCLSVSTDPDAPGYLPLYIKLHGTASEPDSLRLTREAYYKLSQKLMDVVEELLESETAVILNVGSAMTGFDLHRLLRIPQRLGVYDLSYKPLSPSVRRAITIERRNPMKDSFHEDEDRDDPQFHLPVESLASGTTKPKCDGWLQRLTRVIGHRSGKHADPKSLAHLVDFRSADRHEAIADVLGPSATLNRWIKDQKGSHDEYVESFGSEPSWSLLSLGRRRGAWHSCHGWPLIAVGRTLSCTREKEGRPQTSRPGIRCAWPVD